MSKPIPHYCTECSSPVGNRAITCSPACRQARWRRLKNGQKDRRGLRFVLGLREARSVREFFEPASALSWPPEMERRRFEDIRLGRAREISLAEIRALECYYPGVRRALERN